ncbi:MAG: 50S ribosomal protein L32 [Proteobacteria bacterium]|nr:50S ribosomal protein L32 [Pseudomonadota bacterium]
MAVPKKKTSRARRDRRRAHHDRIDAPTVSSCTECGAPVSPHQVCPACGMYRGRQVIEMEEEVESSDSKK